MYVFCSIVIVIVSILLVGVVVIQNSKGGGLAAGFASANQVMGVRKTTDSLEKLTWWFAGIIVAFCIVATIFLPRQTVEDDSVIKEDVIETLPTQDINALPPAFDQVPAEEEAAE
ncbi:MAG: preprotein translocase subunit SecG [Dysgonamonadaceae bacterium]|jgi:preprotein translocase subunit SecG|nr:preprotein translocase subunit SecG [Dysgonamonadaceae bacterium]